MRRIALATFLVTFGIFSMALAQDLNLDEDEALPEDRPAAEAPAPETPAPPPETPNSIEEMVREDVAPAPEPPQPGAPEDGVTPPVQTGSNPVLGPGESKTNQVIEVYT